LQPIGDTRFIFKTRPNASILAFSMKSHMLREAFCISFLHGYKRLEIRVLGVS